MHCSVLLPLHLYNLKNNWKGGETFFLGYYFLCPSLQGISKTNCCTTTQTKALLPCTFKFSPFCLKNSLGSRVWCQPLIVFWCFCGSTIEFNSQQPKQTFVILYASNFLWHAAHLIMQARGALTKQGAVCKPPWPSMCGVTCNYHYLEGSLKASWCCCTPVQPLQSVWVNICTQRGAVERVLSTATAPSAWNIQHIKCLHWCGVVGFHSDLISSDDSFMRCDCPPRLASAQIPCSSHGKKEMEKEESDTLQGLLCRVSVRSEIPPLKENAGA